MDPQTLLDSLDVGVVVLARDWTIEEWAGAMTRLTGLSGERVKGQNFWITFPGAKGTHVERALEEVLGDGTARTFLFPAGGDGRSFEGDAFETHVSRSPRGQLILRLRQVRAELPAETRAGQILMSFEAERRLYHQLFVSLPSPALVVGVDGTILEINPAAVLLLDAPDEQSSRGRKLAEWISTSQRQALLAALRDAVQKPQQMRLGIEVDGDPLAEIEAVIHNVDPGRPVAKLLFLAVDVSREVLLQRKLLQTDRLAQLGALVSGVAHELNNPLAAIAAFAELLAVDARSSQLKESAEVIHTEAERAGRIVRTLLDFARHRPQTRQPIDLRDAVDRVATLQRSALKKARVHLSSDIPDHVPDPVGDPQELQQVLLNGIVNSIQAIESTGKPGKILIWARRTDAYVSVMIDDNGPGVKPEALECAFDPFFTTKGDQGTGLGLSMSYGLVKQMGGRLFLVNLEAGGARLGIELPAADAKPPRDRGETFRPAERPLSVLLVEDEPSVRRGLELMARRLGHEVTLAADYAEAVRHLGPALAYDVMLVDIHLDEDHTGFDLFEQLRLEGRGRERRVIFTTGDSMSAKTRQALQISERPVLRKPFNLEDLREMLDRVAGT
jgi:signal transduction histidine kinase/CheY-like chemotaxis protein